MAMNDKQVRAEAERLGIDISGMSWNERKSAVSKALIAERSPIGNDELEELQRKLAIERAKNKQLKVKYEGYDGGRAPSHEEMMNNPIIIAPHIPEKGEPGKPKGMTKEELNYDVAYDTNDWIREGMPANLANNEWDRQSGTFQHKGYKTEKVIGVRGDPCFNAGLIWRPGDKFWSVYVGDVDNPEQEEFLWAQIKSLLKTINNGIYLSKYRTELYGNTANGINGMINQIKGRYTLPKPYANDLIDRIEKAERKRMEEDNG